MNSEILGLMINLSQGHMKGVNSVHVEEMIRNVGKGIEELLTFNPDSRNKALLRGVSTGAHIVDVYLSDFGRKDPAYVERLARERERLKALSLEEKCWRGFVPPLGHENDPAYWNYLRHLWLYLSLNLVRQPSAPYVLV